MKIALRKAIEEESLVLYKENAERKKNHSFYTIRCLFVITQTLKERQWPTYFKHKYIYISIPIYVRN